ncbi:MAG: restriction endonuclease subunit S [bacterium]|nr:restriction endonuclease subunit S [bacterium]
MNPRYLNSIKIEDLDQSAAIPSLRLEQLYSIQIPLPPFDEQRRIVARIEELTEHIDEARRLRAEAIQEIEGLISVTIGNCIPGFKTIQLKSIVDSYKNGIYKQKQYYGKGLPSIRMYNIQDGKVALDGAPLLEVSPGELETYGLEPGDILINRVNSIELVGKTGLVGDDLGPCTFESKNIRLRVQHELAEPGYIVAVLNSGFVKAQIQSVLKPAIGQATINQKDLDGFLIPLPSINIQRRILEYLNSIQDKVDQLYHLQEKTQAELDTLSQAILAKAFRGEL